MGREALAQVTFRGATAETKVLLEGSELILRGGHKARLSRAGLSDVRVGADGLRLSAAGEVLHIALPEDEAAKWIKAILTPPPSLADKLGIGSDRPAFVLGKVDDAELSKALDGAATPDQAQAVVAIAAIESAAELSGAIANAQSSGMPLWAVYPKGKTADPGDAQIRSAFRAAGLMDNKTCAVSERLTATRYAAKRAA